MTTLQRAEAAEHALPREPLPPCCVLGRRGFEFGLVGSYLARQLGALPLKGLPLAKRPRHAGPDYHRLQ